MISSPLVKDSGNRLCLAFVLGLETVDVCLIHDEPLLGEAYLALGSPMPYKRPPAFETAVVGGQQFFLRVRELDQLVAME